MGVVDFLYTAPTWLMATVVCGFVIASTIAALLVVNRFWARDFRRAHNDIAGFLIAVVGVIYAVLVSSLAITVLERKDQAEAVVVLEADTVADLDRAFMRLAASVRADLHAGLATYLADVIDREWPEMNRAQQPITGTAALDDLWRDVMGLPVQTLADMVTVQDLRSHLDQLYDARRERGILATSGVDPVVWSVVLLGTVLTITFGVLFGVANFLSHMVMSCLLSFSIALLIVMIIAIDWPFFGADAVSPEPLQAVAAAMVGRTG